MFTIEQAGSIKKVNTIDELIIDYIRKYSCQGGLQGVNTEEIKKMLEPYALLTDLFEFLKTEEFNKEIMKYVSNEELENEYRKKNDLTYENTTLLTTTAADERYNRKDDIPTVVNSQQYDESSTTNDVAVPTVKLVEELTKDKLFTYDEEKNEIVMTNTDNSKHVSLESNYGDPALKIINYGSSYNEVNFGLTHSTFIISDDSNKDFLRYDKIDKKTYLQNPCNINFEPLLTEVAANEKYVKTTGNSTIEGTINIHPQYNTVINGCYENNKGKYIVFGENEDKSAEFSYYYNTEGSYGHFNINVDNGQLLNVTRKSFQETHTTLYSNLNIGGNLSVSGTITGTIANSNTITHYAPIETSVNSISDFIVGAPVYLTGNVYKRKNDTWEESTAEDTTDCICSVKTQGTWKEYIGICTKIDTKNNSVTFASHGDYLVRVTDSSCYCTGDEVFIDDDNKLKILAGATAVTAKIRRMTVGIITSIINTNMLAVFKA